MGAARGTPIAVAVITAAATILVGYLQFCARSSDDSDGHQFTGRVIDAATQRPIAGAKVTPEAKGVAPLLYTDSEGVFMFLLRSRYIRIRVEKDGYQPYDRRIDGSAADDVQEIRLNAIPHGVVSSTTDESQITGTSGSTSGSSSDDSTADHEQTIEGVRLRLRDCARRADTLSCKLTAISTQKDYQLLLWGKSRLIDENGGIFLTSSIRLGRSETSGQYSSCGEDLPRAVPVDGHVRFAGVSAGTNPVPLIEVVSSVGNFQYRRVRVN